MLTITEASTLTKKQTRTYGPKEMRPNGAHITATVRFDDQCGNGHNTFSITGSTTDGQGGCIHDLVAVHFPELPPFIKWHLTNTDGPMHYVANTVYHVEQNNLAYARSSAVWPDATEEELTAPGLKERLGARLPALMAEFRQAVESLGFTW